MQIKHLECFLALSETLNFSHAAEGMYITQPAFSRYIASLEDEMGVQLFRRDKRSVELTAAGRAFLPYAQKAVIACDIGLHTAKRITDGWSASISLGFIHDTRNESFPAFAAQFAQEHPDTELQLLEFPYYELEQALRQKEVDAILGPMHAGYDSAEYGALEYGRLSYCVALHKSHPLADRRQIFPQEILHEPFVILMHSLIFSGFSNPILGICAQYGTTPNIVSRSKVLPSVLFKIACNQGISILTSASAAWAPPEVHFVPLADTEEYIQALIWRREREDAIQVFLEDFRDYFHRRQADSPSL